MITPPTLSSKDPTVVRSAVGLAGLPTRRGAYRSMSPFPMTAAKAVANTEPPIAACAKILEDGTAG